MADILVVEDDEANREFIRFVLRERRPSGADACDGQQALDAVAAQVPDLIVLDVMLPEVHGYEVCHRLKQSDKTAGIKILILSAKTFSADRTRPWGWAPTIFSRNRRNRGYWWNGSGCC
jgi:CheY-like chemotaxis protein